MSFKISVKNGINIYPTTTGEKIKFSRNSLHNKQYLVYAEKELVAEK